MSLQRLLRVFELEPDFCSFISATRLQQRGTGANNTKRMVVLIIAVACNRPDMIEPQLKGFKKFLADEWKFVIYNNAHEISFRNQIRRECKDWESLIKMFHHAPTEIHH